MKCTLCKDKGIIKVRRQGHARTLPCRCGQKPVKVLQVKKHDD